MRILLISCLFLSSLFVFCSAVEGTPVDCLQKLLTEIAPVDQPVRPPYDIFRHDLSLTVGVHSRSEMLRASRYTWQQGIEQRYHHVRTADWGNQRGEYQADLDYILHAFGELPTQHALVSAREAGPAQQLRLAELLLAECDYVTALRELWVLAGDSAVGRKAVALIVRHERLREALAGIDRVPLPADLRDLTSRLRERYPVLDELIAEEMVRSLQNEYQEVIEDESIIEEEEIVSEEFELFEYMAEGGRRGEIVLETTSSDFFFSRSGATVISSDRVTYDLYTRYHGSMELALYRCETEEEWRAFDSKTVAEEKPWRRWTETSAALSTNNKSLESTQYAVSVEDLEEGYYLLTCRARYAPMLAFRKFCISRVRVFMSVARNQALVTAVDRRNGTPLQERPLTVRVEEKEGAFSEEFCVQTGADGCAVIPLQLKDDGRRYTCTVQHEGLSYARSSVTYEGKTPVDVVKTMVWTNQPIYRPGASVQFKGVCRRFNGQRVAAFDASERKNMLVVVRNEKGEQLWKKSVVLSETGCIQGAFVIPQSAALGLYYFYINNKQTQSFSVEEYRLPTFQVKLIKSSGSCLSGGDKKMLVSVQYPHGKPVAHADVEILSDAKGDNPVRTVCRTNEEGKAQCDIHLPKVFKNRYISVVATVRDLSGESYSDDTEFWIEVVPFNVSASVKKERVGTGKRTQIDVVVTTHSGQPLSDVSVFLDDRNRAWKTGKKGTVSLPLRFLYKEKQTIRIRAVQGDQMALWKKTYNLVNKKEEVLSTPEDRVSLSSVGHVDAGEPVSITVHVSSRNGLPRTVLFTMAHMEFLDYRCMVLPPGKHTVTFETSPAHAPNCRLFALLLDGEPLLRRRYYRNRRKSDSCTINVRPVHKIMQIDVETDKSVYKPGEQCSVRIRARTHTGEPVVNADISLAIVDKALYWLKEDTSAIEKYFYQYSLPTQLEQAHEQRIKDRVSGLYWLGPKLIWACQQPQIWSGRSGGNRRSECVGAFGGRRRSINDCPLRQDFRETAFWVADLHTDENGWARCTFPFPDSVTDWRFTARGVTVDSVVGQVRSYRGTMLPLQVSCSVPRALRSGDHVSLSVVSTNHTDQQRHLTVEYAAADVSGHKNQLLAAREQGSVATPMITVGNTPMRLEASVVDLVTAEQDAIRKIITPLPSGHGLSRSFAGSVDENGIHIPLPQEKDLVRGSAHVEVCLEDGVAGVVESALDELIAYPYGCVEQTMSRFMPAVVAVQAMERSGLSCSKATLLPRVIEKGLARLRDFQHEDGGWGWWKHDATNHYMTAYVLEGLALCRAAGLAVPSSMIDPAVAHLYERLVHKRLQGRHPYSLDAVSLEVAVCHALARAVQEEKMRTALCDVLVQRDLQECDIDMLYVAEALMLLNEQEAANMLFARYEKMNISETSETPRKWLVRQALALRIAQRVGKNDVFSHKYAQAIIGKRQGKSWGDTLTDAHIIRALSGLVRAGKPSVVIVRYGDHVQKVDMRTATRQRIQFPVSENGGTVTVQMPNAGSVFWSARWQARSTKRPQLSEQPKAIINYEVKDISRDKSLAQKDDRLIVTTGHTLEVVVKCELHEAMSFLRITVPRPGGIEFLQSPNKEVNALEVRDDAIHAFVDYWDAGVHELRFLVRAERAGLFFAPLPELSPMYESETAVQRMGPEYWQVQAP